MVYDRPVPCVRDAMLRSQRQWFRLGLFISNGREHVICANSAYRLLNCLT